MAQYYGTLQGSGGSTTRQGTKSSGLEVTAQSYQGDIEVSFTHSNGVDVVQILVCEHDTGTGQILYYGPVKDLLSKEWRTALVRTFAEQALQEEAKR